MFITPVFMTAKIQKQLKFLLMGDKKIKKLWDIYLYRYKYICIIHIYLKSCYLG